MSDSQVEIDLTRNDIEVLLKDGHITEEQYNGLLIEAIPSVWSSTYLRNYNMVKPDGESDPWHVRDYQAVIMDDPQSYKVLCLGRQIGKTAMLCIDAVFRCQRTPATKCLIVTPYKSQAQLIYDNIIRFIETSPFLETSSNRSNPFEIYFPNNSKISLFTAGVSTGGNADTLRGQTAHCLYIDEADYIDDASLDAIMMTTASIEKPRVWISSTPTGRKGYFYKVFNDPSYKSYQLPSHVSPMWSDDKDKRAKLTLTEAGYSHEVLAEFGSNEEGVFRKIDITSAFYGKRYDEQLPTFAMLNEKKWDRKYLGIDWNGSQNGVQFSIIGVNMPKQAGLLSEIALIEKHVISGSEFTQSLAIEKIIELNKLLNFNLIFVDQGYGGMQVEVMHRYGVHHPESGLGEKLRGIDFYGTTDVYDPILNDTIKKRNKHLMIDNLARLLERKMVILPSDELGEGNLEYQLINYSVARWTPTGQPVYECIGTPDHFFDSFLLAVNAFYMHEGAFDDPMKIFKEGAPAQVSSDRMQVDIRKALNNKIAKTGMPLRSYDAVGSMKKKDIDPGDPDPTRKIEMLPTGTINQWYNNKMQTQMMQRIKGTPAKMGHRRGTRMSYA